MMEQISALADDEIALADAEHLMAAMQTNSHGAQAWAHYHLIGDVMRGADMLSANFKQNLMQKIELEPTVLSPNAGLKNQAQVQVLPAERKNKLPVAWAMAASFAAVMAVGWMVLQTQVIGQAKPEMLAQASVTAPEASAPEMQTASVNQAVPAEYLMAHQASAPSTTSYYIQSASYSE